MGHKKLLFAAITAFLLGITANAAEPARFRFGADWGVVPQVFHTNEATYITMVGYRVSDPFRRDFQYFTNGYMTFNAGFEFANHFALYAKTGWMGISEDYRIMPLIGELQYFFKSYMGCDSPFMMVYGGTGLHGSGFSDKIAMAGIGAGHRHCLSNSVSIDATLRIQWCGYNPLPVDEFEGIVSRDRVIFSFANSVAVGFGLSLNF